MQFNNQHIQCSAVSALCTSVTDGQNSHSIHKRITDKTKQKI